MPKGKKGQNDILAEEAPCEMPNCLEQVFSHYEYDEINFNLDKIKIKFNIMPEYETTDEGVIVTLDENNDHLLPFYFKNDELELNRVSILPKCINSKCKNMVSCQSEELNILCEDCKSGSQSSKPYYCERTMSLARNRQPELSYIHKSYNRYLYYDIISKVATNYDFYDIFFNVPYPPLNKRITKKFLIELFYKSNTFENKFVDNTESREYMFLKSSLNEKELRKKILFVLTTINNDRNIFTETASGTLRGYIGLTQDESCIKKISGIPLLKLPVEDLKFKEYNFEFHPSPNNKEIKDLYRKYEWKKLTILKKQMVEEYELFNENGHKLVLYDDNTNNYISFRNIV